jgi:CBS domain containing-hemolysin-like protein
VTTLLVGKEKSSDNILHIDEFRTLVDDVVKNGELGSSEKLMIFNLLEAGATEVIEIMIPRTQIPFVNITWDKQQLKQFFHISWYVINICSGIVVDIWECIFRAYFTKYELQHLFQSD